MFKKFSKKCGFTLIELLVVIAIIGILSSMVLVSLGGARTKARDARRESDLRQTMLAMEMYYDDNQGRYLEHGTAGSLSSPPGKIGQYLDPLPQDPGNTPISCPDGYEWWGNTGNPSRYCMYACLESDKFFAASPRGTKIRNSAPTGLDDCW